MLSTQDPVCLVANFGGSPPPKLFSTPHTELFRSLTLSLSQHLHVSSVQLLGTHWNKPRNLILSFPHSLPGMLSRLSSLSSDLPSGFPTLSLSLASPPGQNSWSLVLMRRNVQVHSHSQRATSETLFLQILLYPTLSSPISSSESASRTLSLVPTPPSHSPLKIMTTLCDAHFSKHTSMCLELRLLSNPGLTNLLLGLGLTLLMLPCLVELLDWVPPYTFWHAFTTLFYFVFLC